MSEKRIRVVLIGGFFVILIIAGAAWSGWLDAFTKDGSLDPNAIGALILYWCLFAIAVVVVMNIRHRTLEVVMMLGVIGVVLWVVNSIFVRWVLFPDKVLPRAGSFLSSEFHHARIPNGLFWGGKLSDGPMIVRTNEDGFRTSYSRRSVQAFDHRIAILGDSFVFGVLLQEDQTLAVKLEQELHRKLQNASVAVLNTGEVSYSPFLERIVYERKVRAYKPTLVLLILDVSDIGDDIRYEREAVFDRDPVRFREGDLETLSYHGPVIHWLGFLLRYPFTVLADNPAPKSFSSTQVLAEIDGVKERDVFFIYEHSLERTRPYFQRTLEHINAIAREARNDGARFMAIVTPRFHHWNRSECLRNREKGRYRLDAPFQFEYFRFFDEVRDSVEFPIMNLLSAFQNTHEYPLVFDDDPHWNEHGNEFVARVISDSLLSHNFFSQSNMKSAGNVK